MRIAVELFGIPRERAQTAATWATGATLGEVLVDLAARYPQLAETCIDGRELRPGFIANVCTDQFVSDSETPLRDGDTVLLLSLDAGG